MFILGLTGGIACGKSAVSYELKKYYGAVTFNVDDETKNLLQVGGEFYKLYVKHYGEQIIDESGQLDKRIVREIIFHDENERAWINSVTHPILLNKTRDFLVSCAESGVELAVLEIPLLYEVGWEKIVDEVWAMYLPKEMQLNRLIRRDKITAEQANARILAQMPVGEICTRADVVLKNTSTFDKLQKQIYNAVKGRWRRRSDET